MVFREIFQNFFSHVTVHDSFRFVIVFKQEGKTEDGDLVAVGTESVGGQDCGIQLPGSHLFCQFCLISQFALSIEFQRDLPLGAAVEIIRQVLKHCVDRRRRIRRISDGKGDRFRHGFFRLHGGIPISGTAAGTAQCQNQSREDP